VPEKEIYIYFDRNKNTEPIKKWISNLDNSIVSIVFSRLKRVRDGNYGDRKSVGGGVSELRFSRGLRIYFAEINNKIILLLCGGDKSTQSDDIKKAKEYKKTLDEKGFDFCIK
jgi:putative addiction module killer protein